MKELIVEAKRENLPEVQEFIDEQLEAVDCPMTAQIAIDVAVEEGVTATDYTVHIIIYLFFPYNTSPR